MQQDIVTCHKGLNTSSGTGTTFKIEDEKPTTSDQQIIKEDLARHLWCTVPKSHKVNLHKWHIVSTAQIELHREWMLSALKSMS